VINLPTSDPCDRYSAVVTARPSVGEGRQLGALGPLPPTALACVRDDRAKLFVTSSLLRFRRDRRELFDQGGYLPLDAQGTARDHLFAFARTLADRHVLVVVPRLVATLVSDVDVPPLGERVWGDTELLLPETLTVPDAYRNVLTDRPVATRSTPHRPATIRAADVFEHVPIAILSAEAR